MSIISQEKSLAGKFTAIMWREERLLTSKMVENPANKTCTSTPLKKKGGQLTYPCTKNFLRHKLLVSTYIRKIIGAYSSCVCTLFLVSRV